MKTPHCKLCDRSGHYQTFCTYKTINGRKPTSGKYREKWLRVKKKWRKDNPPSHEGYYECYICHKWVKAVEITIDHVIPRSRAPELRYDYSNLQPCCWTCNSKKGSKTIDN